MALWRIRATVDDRPGYLSVLTASLALRSVNILAVQVHTTEAGAVDDFLVDTPDTMTEDALLAAIARGRGRDAFVSRAEAQGLADPPTRALALAGRLVHEPDSLGEALVTLLDATEARWRPEPRTDRHGFTEQRMFLTDPAGGSYEVLRTAPVFTPAEYARAQALVEVCGTVLRERAELATLLLPDGAELTLRRATRDDAEAIRRMHERCSPESLQRRYSAPPSEERLRRLLTPTGGVTMVATHSSGEIIAAATLLAEGDLGEVAVLVEDTWQGRSLGTALLRRLLTHAERSAFAALVAHTSADNVAMLRTMRRLGEGTTERDGTLVSVTLPVNRHHPAPDETPAKSS